MTKTQTNHVDVWRAAFVGGTDERIRTERYDGTRTEKRVVVHGAGSFRSDEYIAPDAVNLSEVDAVVKLKLVVERDRQYAEAMLAQAEQREAMITAKLAELGVTA